MSNCITGLWSSVTALIFGGPGALLASAFGLPGPLEDRISRGVGPLRCRNLHCPRSQPLLERPHPLTGQSWVIKAWTLGPDSSQLSMALPAPELPKAPAEVPAGSAQGSTPRSARFCFRPACPAGVVPDALPEAGSACQTTSQRPLLRNTSDEDFTLQVIIPRPSAATSRSCWRLALVTDP